MLTSMYRLQLHMQQFYSELFHDHLYLNTEFSANTIKKLWLLGQQFCLHNKLASYLLYRRN